MIRKSYSLFFLLLLVLTARSQTRTWNGGNGNWNDASKWTPSGVPAETDVLEFNGTSATISNVPGSSFKGVIINGGDIILNGSAGSDKQILLGYNSTENALKVFQGASLTIGTNLNMELAYNTQATVDGTLIVSANRQLIANNGTTRVSVSGTIKNNGGSIVSKQHTLQFLNNSIYEHARDGGTIPFASWDVNSTCIVSGVVTGGPSGLNQQFGNFEWNSINQVASASPTAILPADVQRNLTINKTGENNDPAIYVQLPNHLQIGGTFTLKEGTCLARTANSTIDVAGSFIVNGGNIYLEGLSANGKIYFNFKGADKQSFIKSGGVFRHVSFIIKKNATVDFGESVIDGDADFTIEAGAKFMTGHPQGISLTGSTGTIQVTGRRTFDNDAAYVYSGSVPQVTGLGLPVRVKSLIIDNASGSNQGAGVTLSRSTTVTNELVLANGFVQSSAENMLVIDEGGEVAIGNETAFVAGPMRKIGSTPFTFPTGWAGNGGGRIPIGISVMGSKASIQAEYKRLPATNKGSTINAPLHHISYCEYWELFPAGENTKGIVTLYRNAYSNCSPVSSIRDLSAARVARSNGISWTQIGNSKDSIEGINGFVVSDSTGVMLTQSEKYFTLGNITTANDPLPVMFDHVVAYEKNNGVVIEWDNLTERDIATYFVERSGNGNDYTVISQFLPKSNRDDKASYECFDRNPLPGLSFYRIKVIEKSMKIIFSKVLRIDRDKEKRGIDLYPNPVTNGQLVITLSGLKEGNYDVSLFNSAGQHGFRDNISNKGSSTIKTFKLPSSIRPGIYNLLITGDNYRESKILIVQ